MGFSIVSDNRYDNNIRSVILRDEKGTKLELLRYPSMNLPLAVYTLHETDAATQRRRRIFRRIVAASAVNRRFNEVLSRILGEGAYWRSWRSFRRLNKQC